MTRNCLAVLVLIALVLAVEHVRAAPLDAATCGMLKGEQAQLEHGGVRANMAKGPEWAKANLATDKLEQVKRLLFVDEQLLFRCSARNLIELPPEADAELKAPSDPEAGQEEAGQTPKEKDKAQAGAKDKAGAAPPAKKAAVSPKSDAGQTKTAPAKKDTPAKDAPRAAEKPAAAKPKPKAKVDDAFKPPPPDPSADPFGNQPRQ